MSESDDLAMRAAREIDAQVKAVGLNACIPYGIASIIRRVVIEPIMDSVGKSARMAGETLAAAAKLMTQLADATGETRNEVAKNPAKEG